MEIKGKGNVVRWRKEKYGNPENIKIQRIKKKLSESGERKKSVKKVKKTHRYLMEIMTKTMTKR